MSTWLDLDRSDDESPSSSNEDNDFAKHAPDEYHGHGLNHGLMKSKSMTLPTTFRRMNLNNNNKNLQYNHPNISIKEEVLQQQQPINNNNNNNNNNMNNNLNLNISPNPNDALQQLKRTYSYPLPDNEPFCVWLGNLPAEAKPSDIVKYLEPLKIEPRDIRFGRIHKNKYTCAYVDFYNKEDMKTALQSIDCAAAPLFMGRQVEIDINEGIVVDREAAVTCTSSSSSLNSPFRPKNNNNHNHNNHHSHNHNNSLSMSASLGNMDINHMHNKESKQDVRYSKGDAIFAQNSHAQQRYHAQPHLHSYSHSSYDIFQRGRPRPRGRGARVRTGRGRNERNYFRGQYGHYRQKNGKHENKFNRDRERTAAQMPHSSPAFSNKLTRNNYNVNVLATNNEEAGQNKPVKILKRPKQAQSQSQAVSQAAVVTVSEVNVSTERPKSRFPTMEEDNSILAQVQQKNAIVCNNNNNVNGGGNAMSPTVQDYISNHQKNSAIKEYYNVSNVNKISNSSTATSNNVMSNDNINNNNNNTYYVTNSYNKSKRHINNNTFNGIASQQSGYVAHGSASGGYKQKRHRNHRMDSDRSYYSSKTNYKSSYHSSQSNRRSNDSGHSHYNNTYRGSNKSYSKKRHNSYGY